MADTSDKLLKQIPYYTEALGGAMSIYGDIKGRLNSANQINTNVSSVQQDVYGNPSYNLGGDAARLQQLNPNSYGKGAAVSGALTGAATGTAIMPGIGTAVGAAVGGIAGALGGRAARKKAEAKEEQLRSALAARQGQFNSMNISSANRNLAQAEAFDAVGDRQTQMIAGLYGIPR